MQQAKPHPIPHLEHHQAMRLVIMLLGELLSLFQPVPNFYQELVPLKHLLFHRRKPRVSWFVGPDGQRIMPVTPYTTRKVDVVSDAWNEELQQNSAHGSKRSHWRGRSSVRQRRYIMMILFVASDCPSV